jgi:hypothetical protein
MLAEEILKQCPKRDAFVLRISHEERSYVVALRRTANRRRPCKQGLVKCQDFLTTCGVDTHPLILYR